MTTAVYDRRTEDIARITGLPIEKVAELFSIQVVPYPNFPDNISGTIVNQKGFMIIGVNSNHSIVRQRFTIAHELGHFLLGHELGEKIIDDVFDRPTDKEKDANEFAAQLLMPIDFLKVDVVKNNSKNHKLTTPDMAMVYHTVQNLREELGICQSGEPGSNYQTIKSNIGGF